MNEKLTAKTVAKPLPKGKTDLIIFDTAIPGFGLRIREGGSRTWLLQYKLAGATHRMNLGRATAIKPEDARREALRCYNSVQQGGHPAAAKALQKVQAAHTVGDLVHRYLEFKKEGPKPLRLRSYIEVARHLETYAEPLHKLPVASIDRRIIEDLLDKVAKNSTKGSGAVTANRLHSSLSAMFTWAMKKELATRNPVISIDKRDETRRSRRLSDAELKVIWEALPPGHYATIVRLLILTGQRLNEIAGLRWSEIDLDRGMIMFPAERVKNKRDHEIPMSAMVRGILETHPRTKGHDLLFTAGNGSQFSAWSNSKYDLDAKLEGTITKAWTTHDLRRTFATRAGDLGVRPHVIESILNHTSGHRGGIAGTYNYSLYPAETAQALDLWSDHIAAVLAGRKSKVVSLRLGG
jgi:integrase